MTRFTTLISLSALICGVSFLPVHATQAQTPEASSAPADCAAIAAEMAAARAQAEGARRHAAFGFARSLFNAAAPSLLSQVGGGSMLGQVAAQAAAGAAQQAAMQQAANPQTSPEDRGARLQAMSAARGCTAG